MISQLLKAISATPGKAPGATRATNTVAKLIDTTTCIGCKACEVACQEWNNQPVTFANFEGTYQTFPDLQPNFWNLIKFNEHETDAGQPAMADVEVSVHALRGSGMPEGVSGARRDRAAREWDRGFQFGQLHWVRVLHHGLPVQRSETESDNGKGVEVFAVCGPGGCRAGAGVHQGMSDELSEFWNARRLVEKGRGSRRDVLKSDGFATAGVYNPPGVGGTHVLYVLARADDPGDVWIAERSADPLDACGCGKAR